MTSPAAATPSPAPGPGSFRTITRSLVEMAAVTGVALRLGRALSFGAEAESPAYLGAVYLLGALFLLGMVTLHLSNYTVRRWAWRAPAFVLVEVTAEMLTSAALIALGRAPWGTGTADLHDWPTIAAAALVFRSAVVLPFALVLGAIVQGVRMWTLRERHKGERGAGSVGPGAGAK